MAWRLQGHALSVTAPGMGFCFCLVLTNESCQQGPGGKRWETQGCWSSSIHDSFKTLAVCFSHVDPVGRAPITASHLSPLASSMLPPALTILPVVRSFQQGHP